MEDLPFALEPLNTREESCICIGVGAGTGVLQEIVENHLNERSDCYSWKFDDRYKRFSFVFVGCKCCKIKLILRTQTQVVDISLLNT